MDQQTAEDKAQIGLTQVGEEAIGKLNDSGLFKEQSDAYRLGIAYALAARLDPEAAPSGGYQTKFNAAGGVDKDGRVKQLIEILGVGESGRPYATAEKLAELGITAIATRLEGGENLSDILSEISGQVGETTENAMSK